MTIKECLIELLDALDFGDDISAEAIEFAERFIEQSYSNEKAQELS